MVFKYGLNGLKWFLSGENSDQKSCFFFFDVPWSFSTKTRLFFGALQASGPAGRTQ